MSGSSVLLSVLMGSLGVGYFLYGRKQMKPSALIAGILLCGYGYFIPGFWFQLLVGVLIAAVPFVIQD